VLWPEYERLIEAADGATGAELQGQGTRPNGPASPTTLRSWCAAGCDDDDDEDDDDDDVDDDDGDGDDDDDDDDDVDDGYIIMMMDRS
jgi:hypothetical protein